jgi:hypothetical protein
MASPGDRIAIWRPILVFLHHFGGPSGGWVQDQKVKERRNVFAVRMK